MDSIVIPALFKVTLHSLYKHLRIEFPFSIFSNSDFCLLYVILLLNRRGRQSLVQIGDRRTRLQGKGSIFLEEQGNKNRMNSAKYEIDFHQHTYIQLKNEYVSALFF
jgi:hypothetical protein